MRNIVLILIIIIIFIVPSTWKDETPDATEVQNVEEISVNPERINLKVGQTHLLQATVVPNNSKVIWTSCNPSAAAVDSNGKVFTGALEGSAIIFAHIGAKKETFFVIEEDEVQDVKVNTRKRAVTTFTSNKDADPKYESVVNIKQ